MSARSFINICISYYHLGHTGWAIARNSLRYQEWLIYFRFIIKRGQTYLFKKLKAVRFRISNLKLSEYFLQSRMSTPLRQWPLHYNKVSFDQEAASIQETLKKQTVPKPFITQEVVESCRKSTKKENLNFSHSLPKISTFKGFLLYCKLKIGDLIKTVFIIN